MKDQLVNNIRHLPSSIAGGLVALVGLILANSDTLNAIADMNPKYGRYAVGLVSIATGLGLVLGVGPKAK